MVGRMKVFDEAAHTAGILRDELVQEVDRDGYRTLTEHQLVSLADMVVAYTEASTACARVGTRVFGGGMLDRRLMGQIRDCERLLRAIGHDEEPTPQEGMTVRLRVARTKATARMNEGGPERQTER